MVKREKKKQEKQKDKSKKDKKKWYRAEDIYKGKEKQPFETTAKEAKVKEKLAKDGQPSSGLLRSDRRIKTLKKQEKKVKERLKKDKEREKKTNILEIGPGTSYAYIAILDIILITTLLWYVKKK